MSDKRPFELTQEELQQQIEEMVTACGMPASPTEKPDGPKEFRASARRPISASPMKSTPQ